MVTSQPLSLPVVVRAVLNPAAGSAGDSRIRLPIGHQRLD